MPTQADEEDEEKERLKKLKKDKSERIRIKKQDTDEERAKIMMTRKHSKIYKAYTIAVKRKASRVRTLMTKRQKIEETQPDVQIQALDTRLDPPPPPINRHQRRKRKKQEEEVDYKYLHKKKMITNGIRIMGACAPLFLFCLRLSFEDLI